MPFGLHGFHAAFLNAVIGIIETTGILHQTKIAVPAVSEAEAANIDESRLIEGAARELSSHIHRRAERPIKPRASSAGPRDALPY